MTEQALFTPHARRTDPDTSHDAAASVRNITQTHRALLTIIAMDGPVTDEQLLLLWNDRIAERISPSGLRTRRAELVDLGLVRDSGQRRPLESGRMAIAWETAR